MEPTILDSDPELDAPPSYLDSTTDTPPPYAEVDLRKLLDDVEGLITTKPKTYALQFQPKSEPKLPICKDPIKPMTTPSIDFDDTSTFRQAKGKGKGAGKAQKQANKNSCDSGDEGNKEAGGTEENGGGGDEAGGTGGDGGGDGGDAGGGDDWNDWNAPPKKKKGKKGKGGVDEEEEKRKKEEEEKKEMEQEDAANDPLSWADPGEANQDEDWGGFTSTAKKGKKGKKDKVCHSRQDHNPH